MINPSVRVLLLLTLLLNVIKLGQFFDFDILRFDEGIKPDKIWDTTKLKVIRVKGGAYAFDGSVELLQTLDENSEFSLKSFYSANGADYKLLPFRLTPKSVCEFLNTEYNKYVPNLSNHSDFPDVKDNEYYCPLAKNTYNIQKYEWDVEALPNVFKAGFYKVQFLFRAASGDKAIVNFYIKVYGL